MPHCAGVLGRCSNLQINQSGNYHQRLTWDAPSTLNITGVEPDISSYIVCSNITTECSTINVTVDGGDSRDFRQYTFPNLRANINFTVTAINIVGKGESTRILYRACEHTEGGKHNYLIVCYLVGGIYRYVTSLIPQVYQTMSCIDTAFLCSGLQSFDKHDKPLLSMVLRFFIRLFSFS